MTDVMGFLSLNRFISNLYKTKFTLSVIQKALNHSMPHSLSGTAKNSANSDIIHDIYYISPSKAFQHIYSVLEYIIGKNRIV